MAQFNSNSLDPDVNDALHAALGSIRYAKSVTTAYGKNSLYATLQKITDELKAILSEQEVTSDADERELDEVSERAVAGIDTVVIRDIVPVVATWRRLKRH